MQTYYAVLDCAAGSFATTASPTALALAGFCPNVSNEKAKKVLGWTPIANNEQIILASVESMFNFEIIK